MPSTSTSTPVFTSTESQERWINHMRLNYTKKYTVSPCVFHVPDNLRDTKPEAYTPQLVGLGPYHHFSPQVQHMEIHKRAAVLRYLQHLDEKAFSILVEESPEDFEPNIRSCYDRYLDLDKKVLAWVVIVDGLFLLDLIDYLGSLQPKKNNSGSDDVEKDKLYSNSEALAAEVLIPEDQIPIVPTQEMYNPGSEDVEKDKLHSNPEASAADVLMPENQPPIILIEEMYNPGSEDVEKDKLYSNPEAPATDVLMPENPPPIILIEDPGSEDVKKDKLYSKPEALVADVLMLENQIPSVLIQKMLVILQESFNINSDARLRGKFDRFCEKHSPLEVTSDPTSKDEAFEKNKHLLHFMYQMIVKNKIIDSNPEDIPQDNESSSQPNQEQKEESRVGAIAKVVASQAGEFLEHAIEEFDSALSDAKMAGIKLPGNVEKVTNILRNLQKNIPHLNHKEDGSLGDQTDIPSASRLYTFLRIKFYKLPKGRGIGNIKLVWKKRILCLPVITLRANSEVVLRNLVAYEATSKMGSTQMRDYVDLMCGLIKSEKDVDLLKKSKIIETEIPPEQIVRMFNGIKKSDEKPDEESEVLGTVEKVKNKFNNARIVRASRSCIKVSADCVKFWRPFFPILVVLLLFLQSVCEIWDCRRRSSFGGGALHDLYSGDLDPEATLMLPRKMYPY